jgi:hypothetical protein
MPLISFSGHAIQRMFLRGISVAEDREVIEAGETVMEYPDDRPLPSRLIFGVLNGRPLHVVLAEDRNADKAVVVTVYPPDEELWMPDFKRRKRP